jgi:mannose-6-phosphate isomerase-like protein (cupin superfamily)
MKYKYTAKDARKFNKHGIDLTVYGENIPSADVVHVGVEKGHFQEFYNDTSTHMYYIVSGQGTFYLNDEAVDAKATDLVVIPPKTRIYYFGKMEMVLTVTPAFKEENEHHVRFIDENNNNKYILTNDKS